MSSSSSSLMPHHSADLAAELSAHLSSALASDKSYSQMNDAKMRGMSAMAGWDQFHGMVLTAHLAPVNLKADPIDEIAKGVARNKKIEQMKAQTNFALEQLASERTATNGSTLSAEEQQKNSAFLAEFDLRPPTNAYEFARDWKSIAAASAAPAGTPELVHQRRYRYLMSLRLDSATLLKGGIPLEMIGGSIQTVHWQWSEWSAAAAAAAAPAVDLAPSSSATGVLPLAGTVAAAGPSPSELHHVCLLLRALTQMASFTISIFSLTQAEKAKVAEILDIIQERIEAPGGEFARWSEDREKASPKAVVAAPSSENTAAAATAPAAAAASSVPLAVQSSASGSSSSSYPMLLSGWPAGVGDATASSPAGSGGATPANSRSNQPARDDSNASSNMLVTAAASKPKPTPDAHAVRVTPALVQELRTKYKVK